jgi:hypothetical protein
MPDRGAAARWARLLAVGELPTLAVAGILAVAVRVDTAATSGTAAHPERFTAQIVGCDIGATGGASVAYTVRNSDTAPHGYRVELTVTAATRVLGSGASLMPGVEPGATATGRALIPVNGDPSGASCRARAVVFDGDTGHHHR